MLSIQKTASSGLSLFVRTIMKYVEHRYCLTILCTMIQILAIANNHHIIFVLTFSRVLTVYKLFKVARAQKNWVEKYLS